MMTDEYMEILNNELPFPIRQEFMENECEALPGVAYPGVRDNRSTLNTKTGYDDDDVAVNKNSSYHPMTPAFWFLPLNQLNPV